MSETMLELRSDEGLDLSEAYVVDALGNRLCRLGEHPTNCPEGAVAIIASPEFCEMARSDWANTLN